jgi:hypothetical protein
MEIYLIFASNKLVIYYLVLLLKKCRRLRTPAFFYLVPLIKERTASLKHWVAPH